MALYISCLSRLLRNSDPSTAGAKESSRDLLMKRKVQDLGSYTKVNKGMDHLNYQKSQFSSNS
jgi:hypothetical protein